MAWYTDLKAKLDKASIPFVQEIPTLPNRYFYGNLNVAYNSASNDIAIVLNHALFTMSYRITGQAPPPSTMYYQFITEYILTLLNKRYPDIKWFEEKYSNDLWSTKFILATTRIFNDSDTEINK